MSKTAKCFVSMLTAAGLVLVVAAGANGNWSDTFGGNAFDLSTWNWFCYPDMTKTFTHTIQDGPDDNDYLSMDESSSVGIGGSAFAGGFGSDEQFADVRVGAIVNVTGDASYHHHGLAARISYFIDNGSISGAPGLVASGYVMHINWEVGPANTVIDVEKVVNLQNIMREGFDTPVAGLIHGRSYYAELDVIGSDPTYVTGSLYEYQGGPLVARTATMVDTPGNDWWEDPGVQDGPFVSGVSAIFAQNERTDPAGYHTTFDSAFSAADGPAAVAPSPADGALDVAARGTSLSWKEGAFATGRQVWFGRAGFMQQVSPAPAGPSFSPGDLACGATYEWRVDQSGPGGVVKGRTWTFTTAECHSIDNIEDYNDYQPFTVWDTWVDGWGSDDNGSVVGYPDPNWVAGEHYVETAIVHGGGQSMPFFYDNSGTVNYSEAVAEADNLQAGRDWTQGGATALGLYFRGDRDNAEALMYVRVEDGSGGSMTVVHPAAYAVQSESWWQWNIELSQLSDGGVDLTDVRKMSIGFGDKTGVKTCDGSGLVFLDDIGLCPARCFNKSGLDLRADLDGNCKIDARDFAIMAGAWLNDGLSDMP